MTTLRALAIAASLLLITTAAFGQSYFPVKTLGTQELWYSYCKKADGTCCVPYCLVDVDTGAYSLYNPGGNGHTVSGHSPGSGPASKMSISGNGSWTNTFSYINTGWTGQFWYYVRYGQRNTDNSFDARLAVGHPEYVRTCGVDTGGCSRADFGAGYTDIFWVEEKPEYIHVGATSRHENSNSYNHWMRSGPAYGIWGAAQDYLAAHPEQGKLALNDMSLPYGGLFDISGNWAASHWEHSNGKSVDVRANCAACGGLGQYSLPDNPTIHNEFLDYCRDRGATHPNTRLEFAGQSNQHIHCQWP